MKKLIMMGVMLLTGFLIWMSGLIPYIAFFLFGCALILISLFIAKNWTRFKMGRGVMVIAMVTLLVFSTSNVVKADAYDYDVYIHPDDLVETFYEKDTSTGNYDFSYNFINTYDYTGKYIFAYSCAGAPTITVNGESVNVIGSNDGIAIYIISYNSSYSIQVSGAQSSYTGRAEARSYLITEYQALNGYGNTISFLSPFYPRYSEHNFYDYLRMDYLDTTHDIDLTNSDYIGSDITSNTSTRTIDDVGFHGSVYLITYKNATYFPSVSGLSVKTNVWGEAKPVNDQYFIYDEQYYKMTLWRLGFIDVDPLSTSKDVELTITDTDTNANEHLSIGLLNDNSIRNEWYYQYYAGYQDATKTDYLINVYSPNDFYANLLIYVYNTSDDEPIQDALIRLDDIWITQRTTDSNGYVFYDNIYHGVYRDVRVTHPNYYAYETPIYIVQGDNTLNIPMTPITEEGQVATPSPTVVPTPTVSLTPTELEELNILGTFTESFYPMLGLSADPTEEEVFNMVVSICILLFGFSVFVMVMLGLDAMIGRKRRP